MLAMMAKFNQPIWDTIHRIEQALGVTAGFPGYRSVRVPGTGLNTLLVRLPEYPP
jgi:hypothetical protein